MAFKAATALLFAPLLRCGTPHPRNGSVFQLRQGVPSYAQSLARPAYVVLFPQVR